VTNPPAPTPPYDPAADKSPASKLRVRGLSDDLWIDRTQGNYFKGTIPATASYTGNTNTPGHNTSTLKISGAFGYAFDDIPRTQIVPYVSLNQSVTDTQGKPRVVDPTSNVALGVLGERYFIDTNNPEISHFVSLKPQYLFNTADQSEIASARLIYAPWIDSPIFNLNTYRQLSFLPGSPWVALMLDVRNDAGLYRIHAC
jgi:hypothetical protein